MLVTGGSGFLGGRLAYYLAGLGYDVTVASRFASNQKPTSGHVRLTHIDWLDIKSIRDCCANIDVVVHAAGMPSVECEQKPDLAMRSRSINTSNLLGSAITANVKRLLYVSTAHVYSTELRGDINELSQTSQSHPYALSHLAGEAEVYRCLDKNLIEGCVLRVANGFGVPVTQKTNCWSLLPNELCYQAVNIGQMQLRGNGDSARDFVSMGAVVHNIEKIIRVSSCKLPKIVNLGSGETFSVLAFAKLVQKRCEKVLGKKPPIILGNEAEQKRAFKYRSLYSKALNLASFSQQREIDDLLHHCLKEKKDAGKGMPTGLNNPSNI